MKEAKDFNLLVVDDEKSLRESIVTILEMNDYKVFQASNGIEALKIVEDYNIDFILTDIQMPESNGVELLTNIRNRNPDLPIVLMMTGFSNVSRDEAIELGALDVLDKPLNFEVLEEYIEKFRLTIN